MLKVTILLKDGEALSYLQYLLASFHIEEDYIKIFQDVEEV